MNPRRLTNRLPQRFESENAQTLDDLKQAVVKDLKALVKAHDDILRSMEAFEGLYAKDGNILIGKAVLATTSPKGYIYIPRCAGTTTATPSNYSAGTPMVYSTTLNKLGIYDFSSAAWRFSGVFT